MVAQVLRTPDRDLKVVWEQTGPSSLVSYPCSNEYGPEALISNAENTKELQKKLKHYNHSTNREVMSMTMIFQMTIADIKYLYEPRLDDVLALNVNYGITTIAKYEHLKSYDPKLISSQANSL